MLGVIPHAPQKVESFINILKLINKVKKHPDGRVSVFTDKSEVIKSVVQSGEVVDIHAK